MKAVLRIAFSYFAFLPLQRWVNIAGALLIGAGILTALTAKDPRAAISLAAILGLPGAILITVIPMAAGGLALRYASSPTLLHLRPHGRLHMMLGTMLAITLVACVVALPLLVNRYVLTDLTGIPEIPAGMQPSAWFFSVWATVGGSCLVMFISSSSRIVSMMLPILPVLLLLAGKALDAHEVPLPNSYSIPQLSFALILSAWLLFAAWYSQASRVKRPNWMNDRSPLGFGNFAIGFLERRALAAHGDSASKRLRVYLLGSTSMLAHAAIGTFPALVVVVMFTVMPQKAEARQVPVAFMFALTFVSAALGYMTARRARMVWLKAGLDRDGLFRLIERIGVQAALLSYLAGAAVLIAASVPGRQALVPNMVLHMAVLAILAASLFYLGLSFVRGLRGGDLAIGCFIGFIAIAIIFLSNPLTDSSVSGAGIAAVLSIVMTLLLRQHAKRRWRAIDWRVAQLPRMGWMAR